MFYFINPELADLRRWIGIVGKPFDGGWSDVPGDKLPVHYNEFGLLDSKYIMAAIITTEKDFDLFSTHGEWFLVPIYDLLKVSTALALSQQPPK